MRIFLREHIMPIVSALKESGKHKLAGCIEENWQKNVLEYSKELNTYTPGRPLEPELLRAFDQELTRLGVGDHWRPDVLESLERRRVLQTTPHLGATQGPRFFCINWLASLGVPEKDFYVVGMYSGIPFSNHTRPGRINRYKDSVNLFPSNMQDGLVYRSVIPEKLVETWDTLPPKLAKLFPAPKASQSYTKWAVDSCQLIEKQVLNKKNLVYLDINEVVSNYLVQVLKNSDHIMYKIFFDPKIRAKFKEAFPDEIMFYTPVQDGKYEKMENVFLNGATLVGRSKEIALEPEILINELENSRLCPGLLTGFLVLAFLNHFKCFGSFAQVEYLPAYQELLSKLPFLKEFKVDVVPTSNLTTGFLPKGKNIFPVDILMEGKTLSPSKDIVFGELLIGMKDALIQSYFTGSVRNRQTNENENEK